MLYVDLYNPTKTPRIIYDGIAGSQKEIRLWPGQSISRVLMSSDTVARLRSYRDDIEVMDCIDEGTGINGDVDRIPAASSGAIAGPVIPAPVADIGQPPPVIKTPIRIFGMMGVGDCVHQRAILRELMKTREVTIDTPYEAMYHDLVAQGLKLSLTARVYTAALDPARRSGRAIPTRPRDGVHVGYTPSAIRQHGSILAAQFASVGLAMPERPDFSLPVPQAWRDKANKLVGPHTKPLMIYRPIVHNKVWSCPGRGPDQTAYAALYRSIRDKFHVVSIANMKTGKEWILDEQAVDVKLHQGELDFEALAGLYAEAALAFGNAGFFPVMAQAVGTPNVTVYGGHESSRTTQRVGLHLAPSLAIEPDNPCDCHDSWRHKCDRHITLEPAIERINAFIAKEVMPDARDRSPDVHQHETKPQPIVETAGAAQSDKTHENYSENYSLSRNSFDISAAPLRVLIYGTCYVDSEHRAKMLDHWLSLTTRLNPDCDILLVDSASPLMGGGKVEMSTPFQYHPRVRLFSFPDNVGHLSRRGRDGWGRAFCQGLQMAIDGGYDYAMHIEGDSLLRLPVMPIAEQMRAEKIKVASTEVGGMRNHHLRQWVETGLMCFDVGYVRDSKFVAKYDWQKRQASPTPENVIWRILGNDLRIMPWRTQRGDKRQITAQTVGEYDWITHCWGFDAIYDAFADSVIPRTLLFATTYIPDDAHAKLLDDWLAMAQRIGGADCDVLLVDTPAKGRAVIAPKGFHTYAQGMRLPKMLHRFEDNIGHLQDDDSERDGWGRAFCFGLQAAIDGKYEYVVHVEGDSLFRLPLRPIIKQMRDEKIDAASVLSVPGRPYCVEIETGLMALSTAYLKETDFIAKYDWPSHRTNKPSPENIIHELLSDRLGNRIRIMPWRARRGYNPGYTAAEVDELDWITHAHDRALYDRFIEGKPAMLKVNLGCGDNKLEGWKNHDKDVDITKRLPWDDGSVDRILAEHVVEHVTYYEAIDFFRECRRVLRPGGVVRIAVPSLEQIMNEATPDYCKFTTKFHDKGATVRGAMHSILYNFGHKAPWTLNLLQVTLYFAGFKPAKCYKPGESDRPDLRGVEGHYKAIGRAWNDIETVVCEAEPEK